MWRDPAFAQILKAGCSDHLRLFSGAPMSVNPEATRCLIRHCWTFDT